MTSTVSIELNEANLPAFLAEHGLVARPGDARVRLLTGGVSNLAFWVDRPEGPCVVKQARARLAVAMEWLADVERIVREAEAMEWLHERIGAPRIPRMLWLHREAKAMVMEAIEPPAENYKTRLLRGEVDPALAAAFGSLLAELHTATCDEATRNRFADATFFDQLRLSPYYDTVAERHPAVGAAIAGLRRECLEEGWCLVHGDYSPKNVLVRGDTLILLDYEVAHWGNPCFDLGFALTHFLAKALHLPARGPVFIEAARRFWAVYQREVGLAPASFARAGYHLSTILLARMDGKSPLEYFTDERKRDVVRRLTTGALAAPGTTVDSVISSVEAELP